MAAHGATWLDAFTCCHGVATPHTVAMESKKLKLTNRSIQAIKPEGEPVIVYDNKLSPTWGARPIAAVTKHDVIARIAEIKRTSGNESARQALAYIKLMFAWAVDLDIVESSPCATLKAGSNKSKLLAPKRAR